MRNVALAPALTSVAIVCIIAFGLLLDQQFRWGQACINVAVWLIFIGFVYRAPLGERIGLLACVVYATLGEIFLSLIWGLYDYRLGNLPLFVPPGHALLFMLGMALAPRLSDRLTWAIPVLAAPVVAWFAYTGIDTLGVPLFALLLLCMAFGSARKLYATMFVLALAMEIYGTRLGNWTWAPEVRWLGLTTVNPPLAAGAFYCLLDLLVTHTTAAFTRRHVARNAQLSASQP